MRKLITPVLLLASLNISAGTIIQKTVCPSVGTEAQNIVTNIETLRSQLKKGPECEGIAEKIGVINETITNDNWKKFKDVLTGESTTALEGEEIEELGKLATTVSNSLMQTIDLVKGSSCIDDKDKPSFLSTLSGVTKEVSTVVGNVTGPYGMAISLGGNILAKAIDGIDQFFKGKNPYNFKNQEEELLFTNQFCAFTEAQKDVTDYLSLPTRKVELGILKKYLLQKQADLIEKCPECEAYSIANKSKQSADRIIKRIQADLDIQHNPAIISENTTYSRCSEMARAVHTSNSDLKQLFNLLENYKNPMMSTSDKELIVMMVKAGDVLPQIYPNMSDCLMLTPQDKIEISKSFNDFMRDDVIHLQDTIFNQQLGTFQFIANKKYKMPLGDYIAKTIDRLKWIEKHAKKVDSDLLKYRTSGEESVRRLDEKLENRMVLQLMPSYLSFAVKRNQSYIKAFNKEFIKFRKKSLKQYSRKLQIPLSSLSELVAVLKKTKKVDARIFLSEQRSVVDKLAISIDQSNILKRYCDYLAYTANSVGVINKICENSLIKLAAQFNSLKVYNIDIKAIEEFDNWSEINLDIQSSRVKDYADHIRDWQNQGDTRWQRQSPVQVPESFEEKIESETTTWNSDQSKWDLK